MNFRPRINLNFLVPSFQPVDEQVASTSSNSSISNGEKDLEWWQTLSLYELSRQMHLIDAKTRKRVVYLRGIGKMDYDEYQANQKRLDDATEKWAKENKVRHSVSHIFNYVSFFLEFFIQKHLNKWVSSAQSVKFEESNSIR